MPKLLKRTSAVQRVCVFLTLVSIGLVSTEGYAQQLQTWMSSGDRKVLQNQLPLSQGTSVNSMAWDGTTAHLFGARNEVVGSSLHIEAPTGDLTNLSVTASPLNHSSGFSISSTAASGDNLFNYVGRNIELFYVRYLQVKGLSQNLAASYDERHLPEVMRRPYDSNGTGSGSWSDRPGADKFFPDIAVPMELTPKFSVWRGTSQMVWMDIYIPKNAPAGIYTGGLNIFQNGTFVRWVPISLEVLGFTMPDSHASKTMLAYSPDNIEWRFFGKGYVSTNTTEGLSAIAVRDRFFSMAHRHGIDLVDNNPDYAGTQPSPLEWPKRLSGELYSAARGYDGPGVNVPNSIFAIGLYGTWKWKGLGEYAMRLNTDLWETWFRTYAPNIERFLYLADEDEATYAQLQEWATWVRNNPGVGGSLKTFATKQLPMATSLSSSLTMIGSAIFLGDTSVWQTAMNAVLNSGYKKALMYNGHRPASGTFYLEDDATGPRQIPWAQYKKGIDRWFVWEGTYYRNQNAAVPQTPLFTKAQTFGAQPIYSSIYGESGNPNSAAGLYSNSDGVLMYPGKDLVYPDQSYGVNGPLASLRMKYWRRGIFDVDYLTLAHNFAPARVDQIVQNVVPKVLWEYGVNDPSDPTWIRTPISWSSNPDVWESARLELGRILAAHGTEVQQIVPTPVPAVPTKVAAVATKVAAVPTTAIALPTASSNGSVGSSSGAGESTIVKVTDGQGGVVSIPNIDLGGSVTQVSVTQVTPYRISKAKVSGKLEITNKAQRNRLKLLAKRHFKNIRVKLYSAGYVSKSKVTKNLTFSVANVPMLNPLKAKIIFPKNLEIIRAKASITDIKATS